jgi:rhodanese-related sulfurtransferase
MREISAADLYASLNSSSPPLVVNTLTHPGYYEDCRIPDSVHIPGSSIDCNVVRALAGDRPVVTHCANRS